MKSLNLKTVIIGVGNMGKNHARIYSEISKLSAVADSNPKIGRPVAALYNVPFYQNYQQMLAEIKPDAVSVVVPTKYHCPVTLECLKLRIPTLVEKPIAETVIEAKKMLSFAQKYNTFLMVGHVERYNPAVKHLKKLVDNGKFGSLITLLSLRVGIAPPKTKKSDVTLDLAIHDIDIFNYLIGEKHLAAHIVKQKIVRGNLADTTSILIKYPNTTGIIQANWVTPIKIRKLYITGTKRFAELDYINQSLVMLEKVTSHANDSFLELQSLYSIPTKEVFSSAKEPLKEELNWFLKNLDQTNYDNVISAINALEIATS